MDSSVFDYRDSRTEKCVRSVLLDCATPMAKSVLEALNRGDWRAAVDVPFPKPSEYSEADSFRRDYLVYNLLRKSSFMDLSVDRTGAAVQGFEEGEESCALINEYGYNPLVIYQGNLDRSFEAILHVAKGKIRDVLGSFSWDACSDRFQFSSGASTRLPRRSGSAFYKYGGIPEVTPGAQLLAICDIWRTPLWRRQMQDLTWDPESWVKCVAGSRADTVPKTWKTDRFICIEPEMNMRIQSGIGRLIRSKLKRVRVDLSDQTLNQRLARIGSITGSLCTIDLSRASDSISLRLVQDLIPPDWFEAMDQCRSHYTFLNGKWRRLQKISSMGNGFTFELETLIFWALSAAVLEVHQVEDRRLAVYGDDIVIHNQAAEALIDVLAYVGFDTNKDKTFLTGPFRESCGKHYFYGVDVTPFYIQSPIESEDRVYWFLNSYRTWLVGANLPLGNYAKQYQRLSRAYGPFCVVPPGYGFTAGIESPITHSRVFFSFRKNAYLFKALVPVRRKHKPNGVTAVLAWLEKSHRMDGDPDKDIVIEKGDVVYVRLNRSTSRWAA